MRRSPLVDSLVAHYEEKLRAHGPTARGMDWKDEASQRLRFAVLCDVAPLAGRSVHEVAAGAGHLCGFLREREPGALYSGSDPSAAMVAAARRLHPGVEFEQRDLLEDPPEAAFDVVLCSGLFHVKLAHPEAEWRRFVEQGVRAMWRMCRVAIAFNLMSDRVDFRVPELHYASPAESFELCRSELSPFVTLRHDYPLHEYTVYVYREARGS
jgi:SAM-dependent methyltransferase